MTEKTEGLSYVEAVKPYANGEILEANDGTKYFIKNGIAYGLKSDWCFTNAGLHSSKEPFRIIKPAPKPVTLNDCLRARRVKVTPPEGFANVYSGVYARVDHWHLEEVAFFQGAITNGWQVEILED